MGRHLVVGLATWLLLKDFEDFKDGNAIGRLETQEEGEIKKKAEKAAQLFMLC